MYICRPDEVHICDNIVSWLGELQFCVLYFWNFFSPRVARLLDQLTLVEFLSSHVAIPGSDLPTCFHPAQLAGAGGEGEVRGGGRGHRLHQRLRHLHLWQLLDRLDLVSHSLHCVLPIFFLLSHRFFFPHLGRQFGRGWFLLSSSVGGYRPDVGHRSRFDILPYRREENRRGSWGRRRGRILGVKFASIFNLEKAYICGLVENDRHLVFPSIDGEKVLEPGSHLALLHLPALSDQDDDDADGDDASDGGDDEDGDADGDGDDDDPACFPRSTRQEAARGSSFSPGLLKIIIIVSLIRKGLDFLLKPARYWYV